MIGPDMRRIGWRVAWLGSVGLVGSQWGHLLVYQLRHGARAAQVQGAGGHAYLPALMSAALALAGLLAIVSLGLVGAARAAGGRRSGRHVARPGVIDLLAVLFTLQLAVFGVQEAVESGLSGAAVQPVVLVYGVACQLPAALVGAIALSLFLGRLEDAVERLCELAGQPWPGLRPAAAGWRPVEAPRLAPHRALAGWGSRGPPPTFR